MAAPTVKVRMDRSKYFSTVHGEREPGDPHALVHFYQDGLPFDSQGFLLPEHPDSVKLQAVVDRKLKKAAKLAGGNRDVPDVTDPAYTAGAAAQPVPPPDEDEDDDAEPTVDDINIEAWLRGEANYEWFAVTSAIHKRYAKRVSKQVDAVDFLVNNPDTKVVAYTELRPAFKKLLQPDEG